MIGTDFEVFIKSSTGEHIPVPHTLDIGSKGGEHVKLVGGSMHRDNIMVELCPNAVVSAQAMVDNVTNLVGEAEIYLSKKMGEDITLSFEPSVRFGEDTLASEFAQEIGCDVDWVASNGVGLKRDKLSADILGEYRCAGGHVHMSYGYRYSKTKELVPEAIAIHLADMGLGTLEALMGTQGVRRQFYGLPGLFRPTTYGSSCGAEYRTPSNQWLSSPKRIRAMINNARAVEGVLRYEPLPKITEFLRKHWPVLHAQGSIVNENTEECTAALEECKQEFPGYDWCTGV